MGKRAVPDKLFEMAERHKIKIEYWDFSPPLEAVYLQFPDLPPIIGLAKSLLGNSRHLRCVLAEELGHHFTTAGEMVPKEYYHYCQRLACSKVEYKARRWAALYLIPQKQLEFAYWQGITERWEMAEYFNVTEDVIDLRLKLLA